MSSQKNPQTAWDFSVQYLKGVGEKLAELLSWADIHNLWELLLYLPRTYEDRRKMATESDLLAAALSNQVVVGQARIEKLYSKQAGPKGRRWLEAQARLEGSSGAGSIYFVWFNDYGNHLRKTYHDDMSVIFKGKVQNFRGRLQIVHPELSPSEKELPPWEFGAHVPVYREIKTLSAKALRKIIALALEREESKNIPEAIPLDIIENLHLPTLAESFRELHFPKNWEPRSEDPRPEGKYFARVVFEELFMMALALHLRRMQLKMLSKKNKTMIPTLTTGDQYLGEEIASLPFQLTSDQANVLKEIVTDLRDSDIPMHRLLQGDVGSGKTMVAFLSAVMMMKSDFQVALMVPTEILADQHYENFQKFFPHLKDQCILLKGSLTQKKKNEIRESVQKGGLRFIIGTQALLSEDTLFEKLGLVIVDEQHRFGVEQRLGLKHQTKNILPHLLVMTATPIPRSLALTLYGDLNMSIIREKPKGRLPIETHLLKKKQKAALMSRLEGFLKENRQIYMVYPLVEENEELDLKDVQTAYQEVQSHFPKYKAALLHGKMKSKEKDEVMRQFKDGKVKILVSTTVIEVGVDVPNASVIIIEHAERFGLSQLHQLRGRVGRGSEKSYCILVGPDFLGETVQERLQTMVQSEDGFYIAEKDLDIRGPGEFLGRRQSGLPGFRVAHLLRDLQWMERAREEAKKILEKDPRLELAEHAQLKDSMTRWWKGRMELTLSG